MIKKDLKILIKILKIFRNKILIAYGRITVVIRSYYGRIFFLAFLPSLFDVFAVLLADSLSRRAERFERRTPPTVVVSDELRRDPSPDARRLQRRSQSHDARALGIVERNCAMVDAVENEPQIAADLFY